MSMSAMGGKASSLGTAHQNLGGGRPREVGARPTGLK
jgi:hypothetical protein